MVCPPDAALILQAAAMSSAVLLAAAWTRISLGSALPGLCGMRDHMCWWWPAPSVTYIQLKALSLQQILSSLIDNRAMAQYPH